MHDLRRLPRPDLQRQAGVRDLAMDAFRLVRPQARHEETHIWPLTMNPPRRLDESGQVSLDLLIPRSGQQGNDWAGDGGLASEEIRVELLVWQLVEVGMADVLGRDAALPIPRLLE